MISGLPFKSKFLTWTSSRWPKILLSTLALGFLNAAVITPESPAAETIKVPLQHFNIDDVILLPTVRAKYEIAFTKPTTWQLLAGSKFHLAFQHSHALLPDRSWLKVMVNKKTIQFIPLTKDNITSQGLDIALPVDALTPFNQLTLQVEQHYTNRCEDPLDQSLWTQVLPESYFQFNYQVNPQPLSLETYPYPIIDTLAYSPAKIQYILPETVSELEANALALVNLHLSQSAKKQVMQTSVSLGSPVSAEKVARQIWIGTPEALPHLDQEMAGGNAVALQNKQWVNPKTRQPLPGNAGVIALFHPKSSPAQTALVISGNTPDGVALAAEYLTANQTAIGLTGTEVIVPPDWYTEATHPEKPSPYISFGGKSFTDLEFKTREVHKITAEPILYKLPVVTNFMKNGAQLWLDLSYSYSPDLNPEFSSLELRLNDVSFANLPLTNINGDNAAKATIQIPTELLRVKNTPNNTLVAQFHLMPDKKGYCIDNYEDNAWGKIMDDSSFRIDGRPSSYLPDLGVLNATMYPYSKSNTFNALQLVLPDGTHAQAIDSLIAFTTRLGRETTQVTGLAPLVTISEAPEIQRDHVVVFKTVKQSVALPEGARLNWLPSDGIKQLMLTTVPATKAYGQWRDNGHAITLEQFSHATGRVITVVNATRNADFTAFSDWIEDDAAFAKLQQGFLQQQAVENVSKPVQSITLNAIQETPFHSENTLAAEPQTWWGKIIRMVVNALGSFWQWVVNLPWLWIAGSLVVFVIVINLIGFILRLLRR